MLRPMADGKAIEVAVLGRGQFVGERAVINDKLRSADCVAQGTVQVRRSGRTAGPQRSRSEEVAVRGMVWGRAHCGLREW